MLEEVGVRGSVQKGACLEWAGKVEWSDRGGVWKVDVACPSLEHAASVVDEGENVTWWE